MDNNELYHYGVLGMRWGIRRNRSISSGKSSNKRKSTNQKAVQKSKPKPKTVKDLSNDELKAKITRLELEKRYRDLNPPTVSRGRKFVDKVLAPAATEAGKRLLSDFITKQGSKALGLTKANTEDYTTKLQKEVKKMTLENQYKKLLEERNKK